jgi:hypothetical protein
MCDVLGKELGNCCGLVFGRLVVTPSDDLVKFLCSF